MIDSTKVEALINERKALHPDDPRVVSVWGQLEEIFSEDEEETINYLNACSFEEIKYIAEVFDDVSDNLQSEKYIATLEKLAEKWPSLNVDVNYAKKMME